MIMWFLINTFFLVTGIALLAVLVDKVIERCLFHLDGLRQLIYRAGMDLIALFAGWEQAKLDTIRNTGLVEFEERTLTQLGPGDAQELLKENRRLMQ